MNTTATYSSEQSWSRRCSTETVLSIQGHETDVARDTSDTEPFDTDDEAEYEPVTEPEDDAPLDDDTEFTDEEIISTQVIEVSVGSDGDMALADSEPTESQGSDSELDYHDYWRCAQCRAANNNPLYRYCEKCFTVRKHFFPPRPKRKLKRCKDRDPTIPRALSQDSGVETPCSQTSQEFTDSQPLSDTQGTLRRKRRSNSADSTTITKKAKFSDGTDSEPEVTLTKTISDPSITIQDSKKEIDSKGFEADRDKDMCVICITEPKSGVFVHGRIAHICCCYKCAVKVWTTAKRCPVCNCKVSNVLKAVVM